MQGGVPWGGTHGAGESPLHVQGLTFTQPGTLTPWWPPPNGASSYPHDRTRVGAVPVVNRRSGLAVVEHQACDPLMPYAPCWCCLPGHGTDAGVHGTANWPGCSDPIAGTQCTQPL